MERSCRRAMSSTVSSANTTGDTVVQGKLAALALDETPAADDLSDISAGALTPTDQAGSSAMPSASTKVYYHIDDEPTPYLTEVHVPPDLITLGDVKRVLNRSNFKYYCKAVDPDSGGEVKAEMRDDMQQLPRSSNGRFELFLLTTEGSDGGSSGLPKTSRHHLVPGPAPTSMYHMSQNTYRTAAHQYDHSLLSTDSESMLSSVQAVPNYLRSSLNRRHVQQHFLAPGHRGRRVEDSTIGSESDARMFSDDDDRGSTTTDITSVSRQHENIYRRRRNRRKYRQPSRASSFSSITESSMSLDVISVTLNMDTVNFLGISIVGQSSARGDNGIYVANIMKGGAVALDGRIEAGDMILQVNDISFENFTNDQAVDVLRDAVARKGPIKLTVAKCFENGPRSCFAVPRHGDEPVRPIDPHAWIQHTNAMRGMPSILEGSEGAPTPLPGEFTHGRPPSSSTVTSGSGGAPNTVVGGHLRFDVNTDKKKIVEAMMMPNSGLDIKNRTWLKIPIPMSFLGSDLVDWLLEHVDGLRERRDARRFASDLLKAKLIAHVVNKLTFTEKCYYVTTLPDAARLRGMAETAAQAEPIAGWRYQSNQNAPSMASGYASLPVSPFPFATQQHGYGGGQSTASQLPYPPAPPAVLPRPGADLHSQASGGSSSGSENRHNRAVLPRASAVGAAGSQLELPQELAASRQSFRLAMNQPLAMNVQQQPFEFFIDNI